MFFFKDGKDRANPSGLNVFGTGYDHPPVAQIKALLAIFTAEDRTCSIGILLAAFVLLIHASVAMTLFKPFVRPAKTKPIVIEVALLASPAAEKKTAPAPEKKTPPPQPKPTPVIRKPLKPKTAPAKTTVAKEKPSAIQHKTQPPKPAPTPQPVFKPAPLPLTPEARAAGEKNPPVATTANASAQKALPKKTPPAVKENGHATCVSCPKIKYPTIAQRRGWEGSVLLKLQLSPDGHAVNITVERSSGHNALDDAAIANAKQSRFTASNTGQIRIATQLFEFKLDP